MKSQGYGKLNTAAWLFPALWLPIFQFLHSFTHHHTFKLNLDEETYGLTLLKGDILYYRQGLIESLQDNAKLVTASFHSELPGDKDFKILIIEKDIK